jgi:hypothetical protein
MSGRLQRLAAQALGQGEGRVRPSPAFRLAHVPAGLRGEEPRVFARGTREAPRRGLRDVLDHYDHATATATGVRSRSAFESIPSEAPEMAERERDESLVFPLVVERREPAPLLETVTDRESSRGSPQISAQPSLGRTPVADVRSTARRELALPAAPKRDAEPNEVHVHIGRIDVAAPPAAKTPPQRPAPARKSRSLADYLRPERAR